MRLFPLHRRGGRVGRRRFLLTLACVPLTLLIGLNGVLLGFLLFCGPWVNGIIQYSGLVSASIGLLIWMPLAARGLPSDRWHWFRSSMFAVPGLFLAIHLAGLLVVLQVHRDQPALLAELCDAWAFGSTRAFESGLWTAAVFGIALRWVDPPSRVGSRPPWVEEGRTENVKHRDTSEDADARS